MLKKIVRTRLALLMSFLACSLLLSNTSLSVHADESSIKSAIEKRQDACVEKDGSTAGCVDCAEKAYKEWDGELNKNYNALMKLLSNEGRVALKESQVLWVQFRDKEFKSLDSIYSKMDGTMYVPMSVESRIRVVRDRALQLLADYRLLSDEKDPPTPKPGKKKK